MWVKEWNNNQEMENILNFISYLGYLAFLDQFAYIPKPFFCGYVVLIFLSLYRLCQIGWHPCRSWTRIHWHRQLQETLHKPAASNYWCVCCTILSVYRYALSLINSNNGMFFANWVFFVKYIIVLFKMQTF